MGAQMKLKKEKLKSMFSLSEREFNKIEFDEELLTKAVAVRMSYEATC